MAEKKIKIIAENRTARHDYTIHETSEAGIELTGTECQLQTVLQFGRGLCLLHAFQPL